MENDIEIELADAILERPYGFSVKEKHYFLYPANLGKLLLIRRLIEKLEVNEQNLSENPFSEAMRLAKAKKEDCCHIISINTCKTKEEILESGLVYARKDELQENLMDEDVATLLLIILTSDKSDSFRKHYKMNNERNKLQRVNMVKVNANTLQFYGKTLYGQLIDVACERYHWSFDYVVWGISYTNLMMLLEDKIISVYLTDDEMKKIPASLKGKTDFIDANNPANMEKIRAMNWG